MWCGGFREMKQYIIINTDYGMSSGKIGGQAAHASIGCYVENHKERPNFDEWFSDHAQRKIVVGMSEEKILNVLSKLEDDGIRYYVVRDKGSTEVPRDALTAVAIEPLGDCPRYFKRWRLL